MPMEGPAGLEWEPYLMDDGVHWFHATIPDSLGSFFPAGSHVVLTAAGDKLFSNPRTVLKVAVYKRGADSHRKIPHIRKYLGAGGNGTVFSLGKSKIAIKEAGPAHSVHFAVERMDRLYNIIDYGHREGLVPKWIGLPKHYGYLTPPIQSRDKRQYVLMEQIDNGVTVEDVLQRREQIPRKNPGMHFTASDAVEISQQWELMQRVLNTALVADNQKRMPEDGKSIKEILPDLHEGNVLVERLKKPIQNKHFKLWIIDQ